MFIFKKNTPEKEKTLGQAMVEFALVLPILLLLVLGLLESGRLLFIYGSVVTASRQAVRYGSAIGFNGGGTRKYLDCAEIEAAAKNMGFINEIDTVDIIYTHDGTTIADCDLGDSTYPDPTAELFTNGDRIEVSIGPTLYTPLVPIGQFHLEIPPITSARTIFTGIVIESTPIGGAGESGASITLIPPANMEYSYVDQTISFTFTIANPSEVALTSSSVTVRVLRESDDVEVGSFTCDTGALAANGGEADCSGSYTTNGTDDLAHASNLLLKADATASDGTDTPTANADATIIYVPKPEITLEKTADSAVKTSTGNVTYTFTITNTGYVDITTYSITDEKLNPDGSTTNIPVTCPSGVTLYHETIDSLNCTATYAINQDDLDHGTITNTAVATAGDGTGNTATDTASAIVYTKPLTLSITTNRPGSPGYDILSDLEVEFNYRLRNVTPDMSLSNLSLDSVLFGTVTNCDNGVDLSGTTLTPGAFVDCEMVHPLTQPDMDQGFIDDDATGYADNGNVETTPEEVRAEAALIPDLKLEITTPVNESVIPAGTATILYTYKITNDGNLTLTSDYTVKDSDGGTLCSGTFSNLAPGAYTTCSYTYNIVDPDDWDAGSIGNTVTASTVYTAWDGSTIPVTSNSATSTVYTYDGDRMTLEITSSSGDAPVNVNDNIVFTYTLKNTGSTILSPDSVKLDYPLSNNLSYHNFSVCSIVSTDKDPGTIIKTCSVPYQVLFRDTLNNKLINTTTATAENALGNTISTTTSLSLDVVPVELCVSDQWTSSQYYQHPDTVYYCENNSCAEWTANQIGPEKNQIPGHTPPDQPAFWAEGNSCIPQHSCNVTLTNIPMSTSNSYSQSLTINNNSGVSVEINVLSLSWERKNLTKVLLDNNEIYPGTSSSNGGFTLPNSPWTIGPGNSNLVLSFSHKIDWARAYIAFSDNLCSGTTLDSGN